MSYTKDTWETTTTVYTDEFMYNRKQYEINAQCLVTWVDYSDYDRETGYGECIEVDNVIIESISIAEVDQDTYEVISRITDESVMPAAVEYVKNCASQPNR